MSRIANTLAYSLYELLTPQGMIAFSMTAGMIVLLLTHTVIPDWYVSILSLVVGYYFRGVTSVQPMKNGKLIKDVEAQ